MFRFDLPIFKLASSLFHKYNNLLLTKPLPTKMATSGLISILADTLCQKVIEKKSSQDHSLTRTLRQSTVSCLYGAPLGHLWFGSILPVLVRPLTFKPVRVITSVILDNTVLSSFSICTGVFLLEFLKYRDVQGSVDSVKSKFTTILSNSMKFWCLVSSVNHTFVPVHYKVLVGNICGIFWQVYMSYTINATPKEIVSEDEQEVPVKLAPSL